MPLNDLTNSFLLRASEYTNRTIRDKLLRTAKIKYKGTTQPGNVAIEPYPKSKKRHVAPKAKGAKQIAANIHKENLSKEVTLCCVLRRLALIDCSFSWYEFIL